MAITRFRGEHGFLSNFWSCSFEWRDRIWFSSEHAYQAAKCVREVDVEDIASATSASTAKTLGRYAQKRPEFEAQKVDIMRDILRAKFGQNVGLAAKLLATGDEELVEANTWGDIFWGQVGGEGENHLGKLLMEIRAELRKGTDSGAAK